MKTKWSVIFLVYLLSAITVFTSCSTAFAYIPCMCGNSPDQCACFIQLGDKGIAVERIIFELKNQGYLSNLPNKAEYTLEVRDAVIRFQAEHDLDCTGWMDDETLNVLLMDRLPDSEEKHSAKVWYSICYIPTDGGRKFHASPLCSDMLYPRLMSIANARKLGIEPCGRNSCAPGLRGGTDNTAIPRLRILPDEYYLEEEEPDLFAIADEFNISGDTVATRSLLIEYDDTEIIYIGNKNSHVFHFDTCQSVKDMKEKNKVVFMTRDEAIEEGYKPCSRCKP